ncbi:NupC/NupG family nucleoside CNT transporter [Parasphingorhabdus sp. DH2-15]|uniref:NupC/NupG family nucleoside CNT transporter n=1 Tax=Parasphingorhabdus sp. DH2-15 TaxID=3444112 RepID=UPI003F6874AA
MTLLQPLLGICVLVAIAWVFAEKRQNLPWRWVAGAIALHLVLALVLLRFEPARLFLAGAGSVVTTLEQASKAGSSYMFGYLGGAPLPFETKTNANTLIIAFEILPIILVTAALSALLWHWRILPIIIQAMGWALRRSLGVSGTVGLGTAANFFLGVVESPLVIRAYIASMPRSDLFMVMTAGMATVSGAVLVLYASVIDDLVPQAAGHIITASLISLPAALLFARIMVPPDATQSQPEIETEAAQSIRYESSLDAVVQGVEDGLKVFLSVMAMLIVVFALIFIADAILAQLPYVDSQALSVSRIFGWIFAPIVWLFGVPWQDALVAGQLMGSKAILNEFIAYQQMAQLAPDALSPRSMIIMTYAMCGFANLASIGLQLATFSSLAPARRADIVSLGWRAWLAGNLASGATAAIVALTIA